MPKLVDYAGRFAFVREAAFVVVRDRGVEALTRRSLAAELGCGVNTVRRLVDGSAVLAKFAADEVASRRRHGRWGRLPDDAQEQASILLRRLLPDDESRVDEELVWLRLVASCALEPAASEGGTRLRDDFQVADRGYSDADLAAVAAAEARAEAGSEVEAGVNEETLAVPVSPLRLALSPYLDAREEEIAHVIRLALTVLGSEQPDTDERRLLRAVLDGLTLGVCRGRVTPVEAVATVDRHVAGLRRRLG